MPTPRHRATQQASWWRFSSRRGSAPASVRSGPACAPAGPNRLGAATRGEWFAAACSAGGGKAQRRVAGTGSAVAHPRRVADLGPQLLERRSRWPLARRPFRSLSATHRMRPNNSLEPTRSGRRRLAAPGHHCHRPSAASRRLPPRSAQLQRLASHQLPFLRYPKTAKPYASHGPIDHHRLLWSGGLFR
jgi:hypothetical protein